MPTPAELQDYLTTHIPLSAAMQVRVAIADTLQVELRAPLAANINHRGTVFGGSMSAIATLACWSALWMRTRDWTPAPHLVVRRSKIDYDHPALGEIRAIARIPPELDWDAITRRYAEWQRTRIMLDANVISGSLAAAHFSGEFVALAPEAGEVR